jgi:hypothetical protein
MVADRLLPALHRVSRHGGAQHVSCARWISHKSCRRPRRPLLALYHVPWSAIAARSRNAHSKDDRPHPWDHCAKSVQCQCSHRSQSTLLAPRHLLRTIRSSRRACIRLRTRCMLRGRQALARCAHRFAARGSSTGRVTLQQTLTLRSSPRSRGLNAHAADLWRAVQGPPLFDGFAQQFTCAYRLNGISRRGFGASSRPRDGYDSVGRTRNILAPTLRDRDSTA